MTSAKTKRPKVTFLKPIVEEGGFYRESIVTRNVMLV